MAATERQYYNPRKTEALVSKRFKIGLTLDRLTLEQVETTFLVVQRFLCQLKADFGNLATAQEQGVNGVAPLAITLQSKAAVSNKTWDGGLQGFIKKYITKLFRPNASKRKIQQALGTITELGGIVGKRSGGGFKVPLYDVNIYTLLLIMEGCEKRITQEIALEDTPCFSWVLPEFFELFGQELKLEDMPCVSWVLPKFFELFRVEDNRHSEDIPNHCDGNPILSSIKTYDELFPAITATLKAYDELFPAITATIELLPQYRLDAVTWFCMRRSPTRYLESVVIWWDVDISEGDPVCN